MSHPVFANSLVPLFYLSPFKDVGLFVRARIYNQLTDALIATKDLTHVGDGRYTDATFFMPDIEGLEVRYDIYTDAGYAVVSESEGSVDDRFYRQDTPEALIRNDELELIFYDDLDDFLIEFGDDGFLSMELSETDESLTLAMTEDAMTAEFDDDTEGLVVEMFDC